MEAYEQITAKQNTIVFLRYIPESRPRVGYRSRL